VAVAAQTRDHRRRWPLAVAGAVLLMTCLVSLWWFFWVPNWRPHLHEGERFGVDVSAHQGVVNWREVAGDNIGFAYIKASEGGDFEDSRFASNWRGAAEAGLARGAYHFFTLCTGGVAQGHHFLSVAPPDHDALPPAVDLELAGNCKNRPIPYQGHPSRLTGTLRPNGHESSRAPDTLARGTTTDRRAVTAAHRPRALGRPRA